MNKKKLELLEKVTKAEKYFSDTKYSSIISSCSNLFNSGKLSLCEKELEKLPSEAELLEKLVKKLKRKSIQRVLEKIEKGEILINSIMLKGLSSLLTHTAIEVEHGNNEYKILLPSIYEKVGEVLYDLLSEN